MVSGGLGASRLVGAVAAAGVAGVAYAALIERNAFTVRRYDVPCLPAGSPQLKVLHLTDMHLLPGQRRKIEWIRGLADLAPDLVIHTGDVIAHPDSVAAAAAAFEGILAVPGVFVLGSNDYFAPKLKNPWRYLTADHKRGLASTPRLPTDDLVAALSAGGWRHLRNARTTLEVRGVPLEFVGVDDPHLEYDRYDVVARPADPDAALTVGVMHAPYVRVLDAMAADGAGLLIAGHTHGGQLCLPGYGSIVTNCDLDRHRAKGLSRWWPGAAADGVWRGGPRSWDGRALGVAEGYAGPSDAPWLEVSAGLGTSPFAPVRFACRPEASLLTLTPVVA